MFGHLRPAAAGATFWAAAGAALVVLALWAAAPARADQTPLEFSAGDQYVETVPTSNGPRVTDRKRGKRTGSGLSHKTQRLIAQQGGTAAAALTEIATSEALGAPGGSSGSSAGGSGGGGKAGEGRDGRSGKADNAAPSVPSATIDAVAGGDAALAWLAVSLLVLTAIGLGAFGYQRLRNRDSSS
jgi:hypothetical protein